MTIFVKFVNLEKDWGHDFDGIKREFGSVEAFKDAGLMAIADASSDELDSIQAAVNARRSEIASSPSGTQRLVKELFDQTVAMNKVRALESN